jgi:uncharacterized membrane protein YkoI
MKKVIISVGLAVLLSSTIAPAWALFESDRALSEKATVSMVDAIKTAEQAKPGKAVEVNMGKDDGRVVYKVEIVDGSKSHKVYVDAITGKVHEIK